MEQTYSNFEIHQELIKYILEGKTGYLNVQPGDRKLYFENGQLVFAKSGQEGENFADILVEMGKISESQLVELKSHLPGGESLGKALREKGFATPSDLGTALKHQIMRVITKVILSREGSLEIHENELPQKMPKLKISTLPLFVKNILLVEADDFPPEPEQHSHIVRTENFEPLLEKINLPDHYDSLIHEFDSVLTTGQAPEEGDPVQFYKLTYVFHLMGMLEYEPIQDVDILEMDMQPDTDPFAQLGLPEDSEGLLVDDGELFDMTDVSDDHALLDAQEGMDLEDFNPLEELTEDPSPVFDQANTDESDSPISDLPEDEEFTEDSLPPTMEELEADLDEETFSDDEEGNQEESTDFEDPIEALNRALATSEESPLDNYEDLDETVHADEDILNSQRETVPGSPLDSLMDDLSTPSADPIEDLDDGPTIPGEFTAADLGADLSADMAATQKLPIETPFPREDSLPAFVPPEDSLPAFEETPDQRPNTSEFIMPEPETDSLEYFEKKRSWPLFILPAAIVVLGVFGYIFRNRIPYVNQLFSKSDVTTNVDAEPASETTTSIPSSDPAGNETLPGDDLEKSITPDTNETESTTETLSEETPAQDSVVENKTPTNQDVSEQKPLPEEKPAPVAVPEKKVTKPPVKTKTATTGPVQSQVTGNSIDEIIAESKGAFSASGNRYTLVFMVACVLETVEKALLDHPKHDFYIIKRLSHGQMCYCLAWGGFSSRQDAKNASAKLPDGFLDPGDEPWVLKVK